MIMDFFKKQSIRNKVVIQVTSQVVIVSVLIIITMLFIVNKHLSEQTQALLSSKAKNIHEKIEQRIRYLVENTVLLTKNELMVNALTDTIGRKKYLTPLVENFMEGKDVTSLDVVDYDGRPIFQTQTDTPLYNKSKNLRTALALNQVTVYIQKSDKRIVVISPIEYYSTTQGAAIVVFDMASIARENLPLTKTLYMKLVRGEEIIFSNNYDPKLEYRSVVHYADDKMRTFKDLGIALEIGLPQNIYRAPINEAIVKLVILGMLFIVISIFTSTMTANNITQPILELYRRVKASADDKDILCSPLGSDDEVEKLARAFDERTLQLQYQVEHDALTSLPNRVLFMDRLHQAIKVAKRKKDKVAVLFMDLDRFKEVNDSFGHDFGDELLKIVSKEVKANLRASDSIARLGGDEFTILLDHIKNEDVIINIVQKIMQTFEEPFTIKNHKFFITCSIGIAIYSLNGETPDELLRNADAAMYKAKDEGRNTYQFYIDEMTDKAYGRITLETQLRQALKNEEFEVYYQPQVDMNSEDIIGMEALVRWHHPEIGFVPPDKFIPLAEETGIIVELDRWVMNSALEQFMKWKEDGFNPGILSLNLSMVQLNHEGFIDEVKRVMSLTNMPPKLLMFEVTESQIMKNPQQTIAKLENLKEIGVSLAVDDFGTGHSSLSYLKRLPIDKIKIDQSFVRDIPEDSDDMELTRAIIAISKSLKRSVIAEGVETYEQAQFLQENECLEAQGYLYHKPQNARAITKLLVRE